MTQRPEADALVIFGVTGDLGFRKIFPALFRLMRLGKLRVPVIGVARQEMTQRDLIARMKQSIRTYIKQQDDAIFARLAALVSYVKGDYADGKTFSLLREALGSARHPLHYLAIPPSSFPMVIRGLGKSHCDAGARVVVEKPFGRDLASAKQLNATLHATFDEADIFRIDHYLGKEAVQNLLYFRFANSFLEPVWNRNYIASIQISMAEAVGVAGRGKFYEEAGAIRDVVQNHLMQVAAFLALEPPVDASGEALRDEKVKIFRAIRPIDPKHLVRGQFKGYRTEEGVAPDSNVETFAALRLQIDSWRWNGVPFYIRAGKNLPVTATEVVVDLKPPPTQVFGDAPITRPNYLRFRLGPDVAIALGARAKEAGPGMRGREVELFVAQEQPHEMDPYERLIGDALRGDSSLFARQDEVEAAWAVVDPILRATTPIHEYEPGTWGPAAANDLIAGSCNWHDPGKDAHSWTRSCIEVPANP